MTFTAADAAASHVLDEQTTTAASTVDAVTSLQEHETSSSLTSRHQCNLSASSSSSSSSLSLSSHTPARLSSDVNAHYHDDVIGHMTVKQGS